MPSIGFAYISNKKFPPPSDHFTFCGCKSWNWAFQNQVDLVLCILSNLIKRI